MADDDDALFDSMATHAVPQILYAAAKLGIADQLRDAPLDLASLAERTGAHPDSLARLLRALISLGLFVRTRAGTYRLERAGEPLLSQHPRSRRAALLYAGELQHRAWGSVMHALQTGQSAFEHAFGHDMAAHLAADEAAATTIEQMRSRRNAARNQALADVLPLSRIGTLADVGGGLGDLLVLLLTRHPRLRGVLIDLPAVVTRARARGIRAALGDRLEFVSADACTSELPRADASLVAEVVHCMDDDAAAALLRRCPGNTLYVVERVLPDGGQASMGHLADLHMLVMFGGRERTRREFSQLLESAGWRLQRVLQTSTWVSVVVAARREAGCSTA